MKTPSRNTHLDACQDRRQRGRGFSGKEGVGLIPRGTKLQPLGPSSGGDAEFRGSRGKPVLKRYMVVCMFSSVHWELLRIYCRFNEECFVVVDRKNINYG